MLSEQHSPEGHCWCGRAHGAWGIISMPAEHRAHKSSLPSPANPPAGRPSYSHPGWCWLAGLMVMGWCTRSPASRPARPPTATTRWTLRGCGRKQRPAGPWCPSLVSTGLGMLDPALLQLCPVHLGGWGGFLGPCRAQMWWMCTADAFPWPVDLKSAGWLPCQLCPAVVEQACEPEQPEQACQPSLPARTPAAAGC